ncbi:UDP-N-acetylmuramyl-tripeptide synthetase [Patescibacteria group bacterium]|nr:UDP-N-acetylmuramyl-tripeptide synthetase [Patescibacteria group bacterium]
MPVWLFKIIQPIYHYILAKLSALIYFYPSNKMITIGVTGTTGKSSTCYFIAQILESAGFKVGMSTTTLFKINKKEWLNDKKMTMIGRFQLQKLLKQMVKEKCDVAIVETTSEGIKQFRHLGINYDILVFTNLYPEHIESHGSFEKYKNTKGRLFNYLHSCKKKRLGKIFHKKIEKLEIKKLRDFKKTIIVNLDDEYAKYFLDFPAENKIGYSIMNNELRIKNYAKNIKKIIASEIKIENEKIKTIIHNSLFIIPLLGKYNIYNVLAGVAIAQTLNIPEDKIKFAVENLKPLPGRLEFIKNNLDIKILIDYAFEPKAVEKLYDTVKDIEHNKIIHVLGSTGGGRDKERRPILGKLASENADVVIVTNEDPYDEDPQEIIDQVAQPVLENKLYKILDRREAIRKALQIAEKDDLILITGKGAEQKMCLANGKMIDWDDRRVVASLLSS